MNLSICVIDTGDYFSTDFPKVLKETNGDVNVVVYNMNDQALLEKVKNGNYDGIILTGSTKCVLEETTDQLPVELLDIGVPILGISYGFQWIAEKNKLNL